MIFIFQQVGVELGLLAALADVHAGALGLDEGQGLAVVVIEHIVRIAHAAGVGHAGELHLIEPVPPLGPARVSQHLVDIELPGGVLRQRQRLGHIVFLLLRPARGQLRLQGRVFRHQGGQVRGVASGMGKPIPYGFRSLCGRGRGLPGPRCVPIRFPQQPPVKVPGLIDRAVAAGHEVHEIEQVLEAQGRLILSHVLARMGRPVGHPPDIVHAPVQVRPHDVPEFLRVHQAHQGVLIGGRQGPVHGVHPFDGELHGPAAADDAGRGVHPIHPLGADRRLAEGLELGLGQEIIKVGHGHLLLSAERK